MSLRLFIPGCAALLVAVPALSAPRVVTDIPPIQSLVAWVMEGVGTPVSILPPGASPHAYSMRPSEARALAEAEIVFWVGEALAPWFETAIEGLAGETEAVELMAAPGVVVLDFPERDRAGEHEEGHAEGHEDEHEEGHVGEHEDEHEEGHAGEHEDEHEKGHAGEHEDEHEEGHAEGHEDEHEEGHAGEHEDEHEEGHAEGHGDEHEEGHAGGHEHDHEGADPHIWLDPRNGQAILTAVADALARIDPENAAVYTANAATGVAELDALITRAEAILVPVRGKPFITAHDAYQYFEHRFALESAGAVASGDAETPGPAQIAHIRRIIQEKNVICVFIEPQLDPKLVRVAAEGTGARIGVLDPAGERLEPGPGLYPALIEGLARELADCLSGS